MIYVAAVVFPLVSIASGIATLVALVKYVASIRRDIRDRRT